MASHVSAHAADSNKSDVHVRCMMLDVRFEAADFRPAARMAVNSLASLSSKETFGSGINSPSRSIRANTSFRPLPLKLFQAWPRIPHEIVRDKQRDNLRRLMSRYGRAGSKLRDLRYCEAVRQLV
jgi:hypothetical protein